MISKRKFFVLMLILSILAPQLVVASASGPGVFIHELKIVLPAALFILALLALRYDPGYALTLIAASMIVAVLLHGASISVGNHNYFVLTNLNVKVSGPTSLYTGDNASYSVSWSPSMSATVIWSIYQNGTLVYNKTGGTTLNYTFEEPGKYMIIATVINSTELAAGSGAITVTVTNPPGPLGWIAGAITGAFNSLIQEFLSGFEGLVQAIISVVSAPMAMMFYSPVPSDSLIFNTVYSKMQYYAQIIAALFLAFSTAYNALRGIYTDIVDLGTDLFYKFGVWALFYGAGAAIYTYAASFINSIIYNVFAPYLALATGEYIAGSSLILATMVATNFIPFGFGRSLSNFISSTLYLLVLTLSIATIRAAIMLAIVSMIPLLASLWVFEWTRKIAAIVVDLLIGLMVAGLVGAAVTAFMATLPLGAAFFMLDPIALDGEFLFSLALFTFGLKPGEHLLQSMRSGYQRAQQKAKAEKEEENQNQTIETRSAGSPTTYM